MPTAKLLTITSKDPIRAKVANVPVYHNTLGEAMLAVEEVLSTVDLALDWREWSNVNDKEGRRNMLIVSANDEGGECANYAVCSWYKLPSGRIEFTVYIS